MGSTATSAVPLASRRSGTTVPAPRLAASLAAPGSASASQTSVPWARRARATDVPMSPVPTTSTRDGAVIGPVLLGDVEAQPGRAAQVDVLDLRPGPVCF